MTANGHANGNAKDEDTVLVVGGGIGGLSAAIALRSLGLKVVVLEQGRQIAELGAGINFSPAAVHFLKGLGIDGQLADIASGDGIETSALHYMTPDGLTIDAEPRARTTLRRCTAAARRRALLRVARRGAGGLAAGYPAKQYSIHRARLHGVLLDRCKELLGAENLLVDRRFVRFEESAEGVTAHFTNRAGEPFAYSGAALIGADGVKSSVRAQLYPSQSPTYTGWTIWRVLCGSNPRVLLLPLPRCRCDGSCMSTDAVRSPLQCRRGLCELDEPWLDGKTMSLVGHGAAVWVHYPISEKQRQDGKTLVRPPPLTPRGPTCCGAALWLYLYSVVAPRWMRPACGCDCASWRIVAGACTPPPPPRQLPSPAAVVCARAWRTQCNWALNIKYPAPSHGESWTNVASKDDLLPVVRDWKVCHALRARPYVCTCDRRLPRCCRL
jgi:2-polyprenyl-6-methoxyphenol hydroxylase-like FAD-dependent oxidoreductase